jgi:multidrug resistance efflux pump
MTLRFETIARILLTTLVVAVAAIVGWQLWVYYMESPWTRDGRVSADVAEIAPDVSGLVEFIAVKDNQNVKRGDLLFRIDASRFVLALQQAEATLANRQATAEQSQRDADRALSLNTTAISRAQQEQAVEAAAVAKANYQEALATRDVARLNVARTQVLAPVNGHVTNFHMRVGDYVTAGQAVLAQVDSDSFYVSGYFEETKLPRFQIGDPAEVLLMGENRIIRGRVQSVARGIVDRERTESAGLLANITPTFSWVRLAQRIPVRIAIEHIPDGLELISGRTATVTIRPDSARSGSIHQQAGDAPTTADARTIK